MFTTSMRKGRQALGNVLIFFESPNLLEIFPFLLKVLFFRKVELLESNEKVGRLRLLNLVDYNLNCRCYTKVLLTSKPSCWDG
jgi:hypothetical protein